MEDSRSAQVHAVEATRNTAGPRGSKRTEFEAAAASGRGASRAALDLGEYEGELPIACDEFTLDVTQSYGLCVCGAPRAAHRDQNARPRSGSGGAVARLVARHEAHIREARAEALRALAEADALALERNAARAREALAKRRQKAVAKIDAAKRKGACLAPTFANVAERSSELVLEVTCATPGCAVHYRAAKESEISNFKGSYLGRFPLVLADFWTSDHLSERSRSVDAFSGTRARGKLTLKLR